MWALQKRQKKIPEDLSKMRADLGEMSTRLERLTGEVERLRTQLVSVKCQTHKAMAYAQLCESRVDILQELVWLLCSLSVERKPNVLEGGDNV